MKKTLEVKADPGKQLTFEQLARFVDDARKEGAGAMGDVVKATVRFNGTLRAISVELVGERPRDDTGKFTKEDDDFLAQQY